MAELAYEVVSCKNPQTKALGYRARVKTYSNIGEKEIIDYAVQNSNIERSVIEQVMYGLEEAIINFLLNGHNIQFWPLGCFYTTVHSRGTATPEAFTSANISGLHVVFRASPDIRKNADKGGPNMRLKFLRVVTPDSEEP